MKAAQSSDHTHEESRAAIAAVAELLGGLLLRELGPQDLERFRQPQLSAALEEFALELPSEDVQGDWLDQRAAEYHDLFLRPESGPLVQSLWTQGRYEGDAAVRVRQLAQGAGVEFDREQARGAAVDHLGSLLLLWARTQEPMPKVAREVVQLHLAWAEKPLVRIQATGGFYGAVANATLLLISTLREL